MEFEDTAKLAELSNDNNREILTEKYKKFVLDNISNFEQQDWDMFAETIFISPETIFNNPDFFKEIYSYLDKNKSFGFRVDMRLSMISVLYENYKIKTIEGKYVK